MLSETTSPVPRGPSGHIAKISQVRVALIHCWRGREDCVVWDRVTGNLRLEKKETALSFMEGMMNGHAVMNANKDMAGTVPESD